MIKKLVFLVAVFVVCVLPTPAQGTASELLARVNDLRSSLGLSLYSTDSALTAAAQNHAAWMVNTGKVSHIQDDGSSPRTRAQNAGFSSNWVTENIYMGSNAGFGTAWNFWVNSPVHYAGMTSPNYNNIGIGTASGANGYAFVLVFGNSAGRLPESVSTGGNSQSAGSNAPAPPPSFVVGVDAIGNIMHEIQPGDTFGDIALIYGYTWEDLPYMLEINGMTEDDMPYLEIGSVLLVPPQAGTYTPTPAPATLTPTDTPTPTLLPQTATEAVLIAQMVEPATFVLPSPIPTRALVVYSLPTATSTPIPTVDSPDNSQSGNPIQIMLIIAVILQVGIIAFATVEFFRRSR